MDPRELPSATVSGTTNAEDDQSSRRPRPTPAPATADANRAANHAAPAGNVTQTKSSGAPKSGASHAGPSEEGRETHSGHGHTKASVPGLVLAALGIVFGDIGTSPLYTLKECTHSTHGVEATAANVLGVLSLIVWSLTLVVSVKYLSFIMRADNHGEGGILALLALVPRRVGPQKATSIGIVALLVIAGASLLYGDGMITPAISVLSAVEGLGEEAHALKDWVVPITCVILFGLFAIQSRGTHSVGRLFGPIMVVWFLTIGGLGAYHLAKHREVLGAVDPRHALNFFVEHKMHGFAVLGSVVLAVTGGEALYADMGHFGRRPIRIAWLCLVFPALLLAYFGQGALLLSDPSLSSHPFFAMVPRGGFTYALVALATAATIIASQALISGAFSLTHQAVQLGFFPRVTVKHTSHETEGQIYVPEINWLLAFACIALVLIFKESSKLAAAYGIAVTGTMAITSIVYFVVTRRTWGWSLSRSLPLLVFFLSFDLAFFGANATKFIEGGYVPVLVGAAFFIVMVVWKRGRRFLAETLAAKARPLDEFLAEIAASPARGQPVQMGAACQMRTGGTAVFLSSAIEGVPPTLVRHVDRVRALNEHVVLCTIVIAHAPFVAEDSRAKAESLGQGFWRVVGTYGFMETPDIPRLLRAAQTCGLDVDLEDVTYFLGRETFLAQPGGRMGEWEEGLFSFLSRNSRPATAYFGLPPENVVELGTLIDL